MPTSPSKKPSPNGIVLPDPQISEKPPRRAHSAKFKLHILQQADLCSTPGEIGALLRREGLYSS
jgi:transposase